MFSRHAIRNSSLRALAVAGSISWCYHQDQRKVTGDNSLRSTENHFSYPLDPHKTLMDAGMKSLQGTKEYSSSQTRNKTTVQYDFIVIGSGSAGRSATQTLKERCPRANIAVIDPLRIVSTNGVDHYKETVKAFDPNSKTVQLLSDPSIQLKYKYGVLLATGSRGAPPPLELFEQSCLKRVVELRATELPGNEKRPVLAPEHVRRIIVDSSLKGAKIAILGSGWEALDLVCVAERESRKKPTMVFGSPAPLWNVLPQYLSSEIKKRLLKRGVDIQDRSIVRYVADYHLPKTKKLELHTAKTFDLLDTKRTLLDLLVMSPDAFGTRGTAALPTKDTPERMLETSDGRPWYKTWSQLAKTDPLEPSCIVCFEDDGRVVVNSELCAATKVFAAGSVAKYPNSSTGNASIAGEGIVDGIEAGRVAAINMSREYSGRFGGFNQDGSIYSFAAKSLPVWRSDLTSYQGSEARMQRTSLSSLGIQALCIGNCDSERLGTRAFWWSNSSAYRRLNRLTEEEEEEETKDEEQVLMRNTTRRGRKEGLITPLYGTGVVFYLDRNGIVRGIMTWGLPFTSEKGGHAINPLLLDRLKLALATNVSVSPLDAEENHQVMNRALARESQLLVSIAFQGQGTDIIRATHGLDGPIEGFSTPLYRYTEVNPAVNPQINILKRKEAGGFGVLGEDLFARDEHGLETDDSSMEEDDESPSNIPETNYPVTVVPMQVEEAFGKEAASLNSLQELNRYLAVQRGWEENENRARPAKEDLLWLRPGDERKNSSKRQMIIDAYRSIMYSHRS